MLNNHRLEETLGGSEHLRIWGFKVELFTLSIPWNMDLDLASVVQKSEKIVLDVKQKQCEPYA